MTAPAVPGERPGGWVDGIGWVALLADLNFNDECTPDAVIVTRWADGSTPEPPAPHGLRVWFAPDQDAEIRWNGYHGAFVPADLGEAIAEAIGQPRPAPGSDKR